MYHVIIKKIYALIAQKGKNTMNNLNIKELLSLADNQAVAEKERTPNTCRLYREGKINIASGSNIEVGVAYTAKIADNILIIYADERSSKKANYRTKTSSDIAFCIGKALANRNSYQKAYELGAVDGDKSLKSYDIMTKTLDGIDYHLIDLNQYA